MWENVLKIEVVNKLATLRCIWMEVQGSRIHHSCYNRLVVDHAVLCKISRCNTSLLTLVVTPSIVHIHHTCTGVNNTENVLWPRLPKVIFCYLIPKFCHSSELWVRRSRRAMSSDCKAGYGKRGLVAESGTGQRDHSCLDHLPVGLLSGSGTKRTIRVHTCSFRVLIPPVLIINTFSPSYLTFNIQLSSYTPVSHYTCHPAWLSREAGLQYRPSWSCLRWAMLYNRTAQLIARWPRI